MTSLIGRPSIPGKSITLRLSDLSLEIVTKGSQIQAEKNERAPSMAAWLRELIEFIFSGRDLEETLTRAMLDEYWPTPWKEIATPHRATVRLQEHHLLLLRQFEFHLQSLDWQRESKRNEAAMVLIEAHGPVFNRALSFL